MWRNSAASVLTVARSIRHSNYAEAERCLSANGRWQHLEQLCKPHCALELLGNTLKAIHLRAKEETLQEQQFLDSLPAKAPDLPAANSATKDVFDNRFPGTTSGIYTLIHEGELATDSESMDKLCVRLLSQCLRRTGTSSREPRAITSNTTISCSRPPCRI